ncbi:MAG: leucine-rich repeat domain-containing protein [Ignavibacteriaceae bacterium]|nr:leucine-rich repeat domain-containing protein [Ignavibacteriaceae bacterium]
MLKHIPDYPEENITGFILCVFQLGNYYGGLFSFGEPEETEEFKNERQIWDKYIVHIIEKSNSSNTGTVSLQKLYAPWEHYDVAFQEDKIRRYKDIEDFVASGEEEEIFTKTDKLYQTMIDVDENQFLMKAIQILQEKYGIDNAPNILWLKDEEVEEFYQKQRIEIKIKDMFTEHCTRVVDYFYVNEKIFKSRVKNKSELILKNYEVEGNLPNGLKYMTSLKRLSINENFLQDEIEEIVCLINLEFLEIRDNLLSDLPEKIGELKNLQELNVRLRFLCRLPSSLWELKQLKKMTLENTSITKIPEEIGQLENLEELWIVENRELESLPKSLCRLKKLTHLYLYSNRLKELPENINELKNLKVLDLGHNKLNALPETIFQLENLEELNIGYNNLESIPSEMFKKSVEVKKCYKSIEAFFKSTRKQK